MGLFYNSARPHGTYVITWFIFSPVNHTYKEHKQVLLSQIRYLILDPMVSFLQRTDHHIICKVNMFFFSEEVPISLWRGRNMSSSHGWMRWNHHKRALKEFYHKSAPSHCQYVANLAPTRYFLAHKVREDYLQWPLPRRGCRDWGVFPIP